MVMQRVVGIALGYEDLNDHDELRHDPVLAVLAGKLEAQRSDCAPLAGKSTLNRLELSRPEATRYHKVSHDPAAIESAVRRSLPGSARQGADADHPGPRCHRRSRCTATQEGRFFHGYYDCYCVRPDGAYHQRREDPSRQMSVWSGS